MEAADADGAAAVSKSLSGRRKKAAKVASKKQKPGSFGAACSVNCDVCAVSMCPSERRLPRRGAWRHAMSVLANGNNRVSGRYQHASLDVFNLHVPSHSDKSVVLT